MKSPKVAGLGGRRAEAAWPEAKREMVQGRVPEGEADAGAGIIMSGDPWELARAKLRRASAWPPPGRPTPTGLPSLEMRLSGGPSAALKAIVSPLGHPLPEAGESFSVRRGRTFGEDWQIRSGGGGRTKSPPLGKKAKGLLQAATGGMTAAALIRLAAGGGASLVGQRVGRSCVAVSPAGLMACSARSPRTRHRLLCAWPRPWRPL